MPGWARCGKMIFKNLIRFIGSLRSPFIGLNGSLTCRYNGLACVALILKRLYPEPFAMYNCELSLSLPRRSARVNKRRPGKAACSSLSFAVWMVRQTTRVHSYLQAYVLAMQRLAAATVGESESNTASSTQKQREKLTEIPNLHYTVSNRTIT